MNQPLVGVDVGGTKILGVLIDGSSPSLIKAEHRMPTPVGTADVLDTIALVAKRLDPAPAAVGVGIAGLVDRGGVLHIGPNLPTLRDVAVRAELEQRLGTTVVVDNDATCAAWGEVQAGAARGVEDAICVTLGTGIGSGIIAGGEVVRGAHGFGGEAGHMVVDPVGPLCPCGRRGCWERLASGSGLARMARDAAEAGRLSEALALAGGEVAGLKGEHVATAAHEGDQDALDLLRSFAWWVSLGVANLVTLLDPQVVVIGGGLVEIGEPLLDPIRDHYQKLVMNPAERPDVRLVAAELGEHAGAVGAAMLGSHRAA